jgi:hypothetical protein
VDGRLALLNLGEPGGFDILQGWSGSVDRRYMCWSIGTSGAGLVHCSHYRDDSDRRLCGVGGRPDPSGAPQRAHHLVRIASCGIEECHIAVEGLIDHPRQVWSCRGGVPKVSRFHRAPAEPHRGVGHPHCTCVFGMLCARLVLPTRPHYACHCSRGKSRSPHRIRTTTRTITHRLGGAGVAPTIEALLSPC